MELITIYVSYYRWQLGQRHILYKTTEVVSDMYNIYPPLLCCQGSSAMTILCPRKLPSRPWTVSRSEWRGWRFSWSAPRMTANPTDPSPGASPLPNASTARVSSPSCQGHHSRDSVGQGKGADHRRETHPIPKMVAMIFPHFTVFHFCGFLM